MKEMAYLTYYVSCVARALVTWIGGAHWWRNNYSNNYYIIETVNKMSPPICPPIKDKISSLQAADRIYSAMDVMEMEKARRRKKKSKHAVVTEKPSSPLNDIQKLIRKKEYASSLRRRKDKARFLRESSFEQEQRFAELKEMGLQEKERLSRLFSIYATQHGSSYRKPAQIKRPYFPNLFKPNQRLAPKTSTCSRSKELILPAIGSSNSRTGRDPRLSK